VRITGVEYRELALTQLPLKLDKEKAIRISVTVINPKNKKTVKVDMIPDTGASQTSIDAKYGRVLGITANTGRKVGVNEGDQTWYEHNLGIKIGTLPPVSVPINIVPASQANFEVALMGMTTFLKFKRVTYTGTGFIVFETETATATPTVKKQAAYAYANAYFGQPSWKKRI